MDPLRRSEYETKFYDALAKQRDEVSYLVARAIGWPPAAEEVDVEEQAEIEKKIRDGAIGVYSMIFLLSAQDIDDDLEVDAYDDVESALDEAAETFASIRASILAQQMTQTAIKEASSIITDLGGEYSLTAREDFLRRSGSLILNDSKLSTTAKTEVTRAITKGEKEYAANATALTGIMMDSFWMHRSAHVGPGKHPCRKCRRMIGRPSMVWPEIAPNDLDLWDGPPAHPNCDCHLEWRILTPSERLVYGVM